MNLARFTLGFIKENYQAPLWMIAGALLCFPLAYCTGKRDAKLLNAAQVQAASEKVQRAASQAELAATVAQAAREAKTTEQITELRKVVEDAKDDGAVGPATAGVLDRLRVRQRNRREGNPGAR